MRLCTVTRRSITAASYQRHFKNILLRLRETKANCFIADARQARGCRDFTDPGGSPLPSRSRPQHPGAQPDRGCGQGHCPVEVGQSSVCGHDRDVGGLSRTRTPETRMRFPRNERYRHHRYGLGCQLVASGLGVAVGEPITAKLMTRKDLELRLF